MFDFCPLVFRTRCFLILLLFQNGIFSERTFDEVSLEGKLNVIYLCNKDFCIPRVVFGLWNSDTPPDDVQEMIDVSRKSFVNFTYCLLTSRNISDFLNRSTFPPKYSQICLACRADYKRVCLLEKYGGLWVDPTTYVNSGMEVEFLFSEAFEAKKSVFGFEKQGIPMKFLIELNFYGANKNSVFMKRYKSEYEVALSGNIKAYVRDACTMLRRKKIAKTSRSVFMKECTDKYFLSNNVFMKVLDKDKSMAKEVFVFPLARSQYQLASECNFGSNCVKNRLLYDPVARAYPIIKMISYYRNGKLWHIGDREYDAILTKTSYPGYHMEVKPEMLKVREELALYVQKKEEELKAQKKKEKKRMDGRRQKK